MKIYDSLEALLLPRHIEDEEEKRIAVIALVIAVASLLGLSLLSIYRLSTGQLSQVLPMTVLAILVVASIILLRRGLIGWSGGLLTLSLLGFLEEMIWKYDGLHDTAMVAVPGVLVLASLVLKRRFFFAVTIVILSSAAGLGYLELLGVVRSAHAPATTPLDIIDLLVILGITAITIRSISDALTKSLVSVTRSEKEARVQAARLRASENRYRTLFEGANDAILIINGESFVDCNIMSVTMFGCAGREDIIGHSPWELSPSLQPDGSNSREKALAIIHKALGGEPQRFLWNHSRKDGTSFDAEVSLSRLVAGNEILIQALVRDVTEYRQMEDRVRKSEEHYRTLVETSPQATVVVDAEGHLVFASKKAHDLFGVPLNQSIAGRPVLQWVAPEDHAIVQTRMQEALAGMVNAYSREYRLLKENGTMFWSEIASSPLFDARGQVNGLLLVCHDVSERKAAERALRESEERFSRLSDASFEGIVLSKNGRAIDLNDQLAQMLQYTRSAMVGMDVLDFVAPQSLEVVQQHTRSGTEEPYEYVAMRSDGSTFPVEVRTKSIPSDDDEVRVTAIRDITGRKQAEESIRASEQQYRKLFESANDAIFIFDPSSEIILEANSKACELYGFPRQEFVGLSLDDVIVNASWGEDVIRRTLETGLLKDFETVHVRNDHVAVHFLVNASVIEYVGKKAILSISRDISYRKSAEDQLSFLSAAVQQSPASIVLTDVSGAIEYVNPRFTNLTGYTLQEVLGKNPSILKSGETPAKEYQQLWETILAGGEWHGEFHNKRKDGSLYWESATISPVVTGGTITHFLAIKEDITARKEMEERLRQIQKMESIGTLAGGVAHDFNNILSIILGHLSLIEIRKPDPVALDRSVDAMKEAVQRGASLVRQILTFARKTDAILEPVSVNQSIRDLVKMLQETFPKTIEIRLQLEKGIPLVIMDHTQLHQTLLNLCLNARDAIVEAASSKSAAGTLQIATGLVHGTTLQATHMDATAAHYVYVSVSDNGTGMDEETRRRVFEPFFTTKEAGKGTGLGLSVVYGAVKSHHGLIDVQSKPAEGTTFTMYLPVPEIFASPSHETPNASEDARGGHETILIVEDEDAMADLMEEVLTQKGYRVLKARDGLQALETYSERKDEIALVLTDMGLPKLDGSTLFARLLELKPDTKVVIASGYIEPTEREELLRAGVKAIISKPYRLNDVLGAVRDALDGTTR